MQLKEIMQRDIEFVPAELSLVEVAKKMAQEDIGFLPVVGDSLVGVVTDRDLVIRAIAAGKDPKQTPVSEIVTPAAEVLSQEEDISAASKLMQEKQVRRILVKDENGTCVGVVSIGDLAAQGHETELCGQAMEQVCASS